jgi:1-acyl-sn-glycerol-3-phosphate acyltransferase
MLTMGFTLLLLVTGILKPRYASTKFVATILNFVGNFCFGKIFFKIKNHEGVYLDIENPQQFKQNGRYVIICNHQSLFDIFLITGKFHPL